MLLKLLVLFCSTSLVLSQYEIDPSVPLPAQIQPTIEQQSTEQSEFRDSESLAIPSHKQTTLCPANEALVQIQHILTKLLSNEDENNNDSLNVSNIKQGNGLFSKESAMNLENDIDKVPPISKGNTLGKLLENNQINSKYKTKITVEYEIPKDSDFNCKQALFNILQVLKKANLIHESYRSCGPNDVNCPKENVLDMKNIGNQNVFTTNINQGNSNYLPDINSQKSIDSKILYGQGQYLNDFFKYLALKRNPDFKTIFDNYRTKQQSVLDDITMTNEKAKTNEKLTQVFKDSDTVHQQTNYSDKSTPYQLHITENIVPPTNLNEINQTDIIILPTQPLENQRNQMSNVNEKPNDVLVTVTNDGKIVSVYPSKNKLFQLEQNNLNADTILADNAKLQNKQSIASHVKNLFNQYLKGNVNNLPKDKMNALLAVLKTEGSKSEYQMFPKELNGNENMEQYYVNSNQNINQYPAINPGVVNFGRQFPYKSGLNEQLHTNLNLFNQISNQENLLNYNSLYPYVAGNPYVNSKLVDYEKRVNELHAPNNFNNLQRLVAETNPDKLNSAHDISGVVELTYLLKRPHPVIYRPVYYVKYRLPYDSFVNNLRDLVRRQPQLRSNRAKLYQELLSLSQVAEVSPNLKGLGRQQLLQMVANNGALVKTKLLKVNETPSDKQLKFVQDVNSNLAPTEIFNGTFTDEPNGDSKASMLNKTIEIVLNKTQIEELENFEKAKILSNLSDKGIFNSYQTATDRYGFSTDRDPSNSQTMYPLV